MATILRNGLVGFTRSRIGLEPPRGQRTPTRVTEASVHHGGPVGAPRMTFKAAAATVREWQRYHQGKGWIDIGYNLLIDGRGRLYQGRPVGTLPAAVEGENTGTVAICFMQDGRHYGLTEQQRATLRVLFESGIPEWGLAPLKKLPGGVKCHNEYPAHRSNECPGDRIKRHVIWRRGRYG